MSKRICDRRDLTGRHRAAADVITEEQRLGREQTLYLELAALQQIPTRFNYVEPSTWAPMAQAELDRRAKLEA